MLRLFVAVFCLAVVAHAALAAEGPLLSPVALQTQRNLAMDWHAACVAQSERLSEEIARLNAKVAGLEKKLGENPKD